MTRAGTRLVLSLAAWLALTSAAAAQDPVEELLRLHHEQRVAHVTGDAEALVAMLADPYLEVGDGRVVLLSRGDALARFERYLGAVRFLAWEDVRPPRVRVAPGGQWAELVVEKRVHTVPDGPDAADPESSRFAWVERWVRGDRGWRIVTLASTGAAMDAGSPSGRSSDRAASASARRRAYEVLRRARVVLGGEGAVAGVGTLRFTAECTGPHGSFVTEVRSARDGRVRFVQRFPDRPALAGGVSLDGGWQRRGDSATLDSLGAVAHSVVTGHELHLLALAPEARFSAPRARPTIALDGREVHVVELTDELGAPVSFYFDVDTGRPVGFRLSDHTSPDSERILTRFEDWRVVGRTELPFRVLITQGGDRYRYEITEASTAWLPDDAFRPR